MTITRRDLMATGLAGAAGLLADCHTAPRLEKGEAALGDIDAHAHVWSDDLARYPLGPWATKANMKPATFTSDELLAVVRPQGIGRVVLIQHAPLHGYDNSYILDCARKRPDTFSVVAMINERTPNLKERLRDLRDEGARGIRIGPTKHADRTLNVDPPNWLNAPGMQLLWTHAAELGVAICPLLSPDFLPSVDAMCQQHPDTNVVIDHFGRITTGDQTHERWLAALAKHPNVYVKVSAFKNFGDRRAPYDDLTPLLQLVIDAFGPRRLMWGSDLPYQLNDGNNYADAIALLRTGLDTLSETERDAILRGTAERLFF
jgi:predicted TIM-barrel fold metal-dependent hydrolase